ncbi:MAG: hypothetical protein NDF58_08685 [archaeon YNP-LCB-024-027]|nr:hypothetical protein [Candidatus Culexarchaeum yellowstonense]
MFTEFRELTDDEWSIISTFLPPKPMSNRRASSDDKSLIVVLYVAATDCRCVRCL